MQRRIALLVGKPPKPGTIVAEAVGLLENRGVNCAVLLPRKQEISVADVVAADLVVHRGLSEQEEPLLEELVGQGALLCNPWRGHTHLSDRASEHRAIREAGLPSPPGVVRQTWAEVLTDGVVRRIVVKAVSGPGRGQGVLATPLPEEAPWEGPYLVEDYIEHDGVDRKLYVAGEWVAGLLKPSTLVHDHLTRGTPFEVDEPLADLARAAVARVDLHLAGVDVVIGPDGPAVVDINAFPGYRGVGGAPGAVADHLLDHLER